MLKIAWSEFYAHPLPAGHRFPMEKYNLIPEQLLYEGTIIQDNLFEPEPLSGDEVLLTHSTEYWNKLKSLTLSKKEERRTGFPLSERLVTREIIIGNGTWQAAKFALEHGIAMNVSGGTHHAFSYKGEGFCLLNDIAMAANLLLEHRLAKKILIIDLDVHQGNGTAEIFRNKAEVFTFSMHCEHNFPMEKEQSDMDIHLPPGLSDEHYLSILRSNLPVLMDMVQPDFVFYLSGVDVLETDKLGKLKLTRAGCKERDRIVFEEVKRHGLPLAAAMGGGYSTEIRDIVEAHCNTFRLAQEMWF